jgi:glycosyltransferase involved in cell wall biosynthesis
MKMQTENPLVSIVVRTRNRPRSLSETLASLRQQTYSPLEVVLVNDFPEPVASKLLHGRDGLEIVVVNLRLSRGRSAAANAGLQTATGRYLGFLDDDDVLYPDHVQRTVPVLESDPQLGGVYTDLNATVQEPDSSTSSGYRTISQAVRYCRSFDREWLLLDNYIPINAVLFRRECLDRIGYFDEAIEVLEDWDFWIRMGTAYEMRHLCAVTGEFRIRNDESNSTHLLKHLFPIIRNYIYRKHADHALPLLRERFLAAHAPKEAGSTLSDDHARDRIARLELTLLETTRQLEDARTRLRRYINSPPIKFARRVRRMILRLPGPPPDP